MKNKLLIIPAAFALLLAAFSITAYAQTVVVKPTPNSGVTAPKDITKSTTLTERTAQRQAVYKAAAAKYTSAKLTAKCAAAQTNLKTFYAKDQVVLTKREDNYIKLANRLGDTVFKLKTMGVDASHVTNAQQPFSDNVTKFLADSQTYQKAVEDAMAVNCSQDPDGFISSVLEARASRVLLSQDAAAIKSSTVDLATSLKLIKTRVGD